MAEKSEISIRIKNKSIVLFFSFVIGALLVLDLISVFGTHVFGLKHPLLEKVFHFLDFNHETNLPSYYSSVAILFSSCLLFYITYQNFKNGKNFLYWAFLGLVFFFLALDENCQIHEEIGGFVEQKYMKEETNQFLNYKWVIPYGILALIFGISSIKFLMSLPKNLMMSFIGAGALFVFGAFGCEILESAYISKFGEDFGFALFYTAEESIEMLGILLFIRTLLNYISAELAVKPTVLSDTTIQDLVKMEQLAH